VAVIVRSESADEVFFQVIGALFTTVPVENTEELTVWMIKVDESVFLVRTASLCCCCRDQ